MGICVWEFTKKQIQSDIHSGFTVVISGQEDSEISLLSVLLSQLYYWISFC